MPVEFPERFNMADYFLYHNLEEGRENKVCLYFKDQTYTYGEAARMSNRVVQLAVMRHCGAPAASYMWIGDRLASEQHAMIYILAALVPPLGLLLNGQPFAAIFNLILIVPCLVFGLIFHLLLLGPSLHAVIAVHMKREDRRHRALVDAIVSPEPLLAASRTCPEVSVVTGSKESGGGGRVM